MYQKLSDNMAVQTRLLEDLMQSYVEKQEEEILDSEAAASSEPPSRSSNPYDVEMAPIVSAQMVDEPGKIEHIRKINTDMRCLHRIYTDLAGHVAAQQDTIDTIEGQMMHVSETTSNTNRQLQITK